MVILLFMNWKYLNETNEYVSKLSMTELNADDAGSYYCKVEDEEGECFSRNAEIVICELQAHWSLDGSDYSVNKYIDLSRYSRDIAVSGNAVFANGADSIQDGAVSLASVNGTGTIGRWNPLQETGKFSIACWVYWTGGSNTSIIIDKSDSWDAGQMMWTWGINPNTNRINFVAADSTDFQTPIVSGVFGKNQWHHLIVTYDSGTSVAQLYIDAKLANSGIVNMGTKTDSLMHFGTDAGGRYFNGRIDDLRIYNCVLGEKGVLEAYNGAALNKKYICILDSDSSRYDLSGPNNVADCRVDLYDFSQLLESWLSSGLYPG